MGRVGAEASLRSECLALCAWSPHLRVTEGDRLGGIQREAVIVVGALRQEDERVHDAPFLGGVGGMVPDPCFQYHARALGHEEDLESFRVRELVVRTRRGEVEIDILVEGKNRFATIRVNFGGSDAQLPPPYLADADGHFIAAERTEGQHAAAIGPEGDNGIVNQRDGVRRCEGTEGAERREFLGSQILDSREIGFHNITFLLRRFVHPWYGYITINCLISQQKSIDHKHKYELNYSSSGG